MEEVFFDLAMMVLKDPTALSADRRALAEQSLASSGRIDPSLLHLLALCGSPDCLKLLEAAATSSDPETRRSACFLIAQRDLPANLRLLAEAVDDDDDPATANLVSFCMAWHGGCFLEPFLNRRAGGSVNPPSSYSNILKMVGSQQNPETVSYGSKVYLVGGSGVGKSTLGRLVAEDIGREFTDLDERIEFRSGKSVRRLFEEFGESGFRGIETAALLEIAYEPGNAIVATGSGTPLASVNRKAISETGTAVFLRISSSELQKRHQRLRSQMSPNSTTHLLADAQLEAITRLLAFREPYYCSVASYRLELGAQSEDDSARDLRSLILGCAL